MTKRKLKKAIAVAISQNKFSDFNLNPSDARIVLWGREPNLFWDAGYIAAIKSRCDGSIYVSFAGICNPHLVVSDFMPR